LTGYEGLFEGEILTRAFSPLLGIGALSPRYLAARLQARAGTRFWGKSLDKEVAMLEEVRMGPVRACMRGGIRGEGRANGSVAAVT
jgi:hypothetical protein